MLRIETHGLTDGLHALTLRPDAEALDLDPAVFSEIEVALRLDVADRRILAAFEARATACLECDRTLVAYRQPVEGSHAVLYAPPEVLPPGSEEDDSVAPLPADATTLDLTGPVRETLLLALPLRRVAPEAEALEIPTVFGAALDEGGEQVDDRWDALRRLRADDDTN
jgi:uncharacterized protein